MQGKGKEKQTTFSSLDEEQKELTIRIQFVITITNWILIACSYFNGFLRAALLLLAATQTTCKVAPNRPDETS